MHTPEQLVKKILNKRKFFQDNSEIEKMTKLLCQLAMANEEALKALLEVPNRFVQAIPNCIKEKDLLSFAKEYPQYLEKLIKMARISSNLSEKMRQVSKEAPKHDMEVEKILKKAAKDILPINDGRTLLAMKNPHLKVENEMSGIEINNQMVPMVNRNTRDFNKPLCSVGASNKREIIYLDPHDQVLDDMYSLLKKNIKPNSTVLDILQEISKVTRKCFVKSNPEAFIGERIKQGNLVISLADFIKEQNGVCRHHALLNAYFLSRLVKDKLLNGDVIHHRQDFNDGAHTWNIFRNHKDGKLYSLDSLWKNVTCIDDKPGTLNSLYDEDVETLILNRYKFNEPKDIKPKSPALFNHCPKVPDTPVQIDLKNLRGENLKKFQNQNLIQNKSVKKEDLDQLIEEFRRNNFKF